MPSNISTFIPKLVHVKHGDGRTERVKVCRRGTAELKSTCAPPPFSSSEGHSTPEMHLHRISKTTNKSSLRDSWLTRSGRKVFWLGSRISVHDPSSSALPMVLLNLFPLALTPNCLNSFLVFNNGYSSVNSLSTLCALSRW